MEYINGYKAEESLYTKDGKEISVLRLEVENEEKVLDSNIRRKIEGVLQNYPTYFCFKFKEIVYE